ncbi:hypothetical protein BOTBODRAFT_33634 [Botryobasidium botryosum FD-172 SS1]|uniref:cystathionine gamma-synthase n=1 Tax=Botryobasidium botryosum (strain FD-172 SS1) TaxID=930990 RepID=A0A067MCL5_BOTB1|nr:hypothetical protein BOTBODRAFT_33634 [Botryobasidium botryosum FD-172 SS1]
MSLGSSVPAYTPHAISVSLPKWRDNVGYEEGDPRVIDSMVTGYPRFFIHKSIQQLQTICERKFGTPTELCLLFPSAKIADACRAYLHAHSPPNPDAKSPASPLPVRLAQFLICPPESEPTSTECIDLHIVFFPADAFPLAKSFWQHTGMGISSRMAEACLARLAARGDGIASTVLGLNQNPSSLVTRNLPLKSRNRHYARGAAPATFQSPSSPVSLVSPLSPNAIATTLPSSQSTPASAPAPVPAAAPAAEEAEGDVIDADFATYLEERYGRNMPIESSALAKRTLRRRIAGVLVCDQSTAIKSNSHSTPAGPELGPCEKVGASIRGVGVTEDDVFLFPTGMSAIWHAHQLALGTLPPAKSICFGFPYTDTLKILQKWGPGCHFFGKGEHDIKALESLLASSVSNSTSASSLASVSNTSTPSVLALFCELPSNPLLRSPNLQRLRQLADQYGFLIVIDDTIGNFLNVSVLPYADIVVSSLTKVFSGETNVMGGSMVLNPQGRHYAALKSKLVATYEDWYWGSDAVFMERNSRDFAKRVKIIDENAEAICDFLRANLASPPEPQTKDASYFHSQSRRKVVKEVYYPKWETRDNYELYRVKESTRYRPSGSGGFGGLFSVTFTSLAAAKAFFDNLACAKGPSLGTSFTLACPYTILAHYFELDWAKEYGVEEGLVRVSVGLEERDVLLEWFRVALEKAEQVEV